ncbi:MAG: FecR family protein [Mycobacteriales bacterium]
MIGKQTVRSIEDEASDTFVQQLHGEWTPADQAILEARLGRDAAYADAYRRVEQSWEALGRHAETPELIRYREEALAFARRTNVRRWLRPAPLTRARWRLTMAAGLCTLAIAVAWQLSPYGARLGEYRTGIGEQRTVELADHSRVALDAATRIRVHFSSDARVVELEEGQVQFSVAHDLTRPFKVKVGDQTIVALGTVFTVEYLDRQVRVAMMEGRVAVVSSQTQVRSREQSRPETANRTSSSGSGPAPTPRVLDFEGGANTIELSAGEELRVNENGRTTVTSGADLEAATAWRAGKVIFRAETLGEAVRRVNRYSRLQIEIEDSQLASRQISGVFEAGDTQGFVNALQQYLPISVKYTDSTIRLKSR